MKPDQSQREADELCHAKVIAALIFRHFYQMLKREACFDRYKGQFLSNK